MRVVLSTILWFTLISGFAQTGLIKGKVTDNKQEPLPFASVYINQTTIGTTTGIDGTFMLSRVPEGEQDLVISYIGFQTFQTSVVVDDSADVVISVRLLPSTTAMKEVQIRSKKDKQWEQHYEKFHRLFFGGNGASLCRVLNPWVLEFEEGAGGRLIANASEAMEIENMNLGYRLTYMLKKFEVGPADFNIVGLVRFHELKAGDKELRELWDSRRTQAYQGSARHFLKSIVEHRDMQEGFQLFIDMTRNPDIVRNQSFPLNINEAIYPYNMIGKVLPGFSDGRYTVRFPPRLEVHYRRKVVTPTVYANVTAPVSWLEVSGGTLYINKQGVPLNSTRLTLLGAMSDARVAELLPYDYEPPRHLETTEPQSDSPKVEAPLVLAGLLEKPYLHLDKPYYYHTDMIFFKAYMNYARPVMKDSLSRVLFVDLTTPDGRVVASRTLPIANGMAHGNFYVGATIPEGDLVVRAYTRWMLNYGPEIVFQKTIRVIADNQLARMQATPSPAKGLNLVLDKETYGLREKATMLVEAVDPFGLPVRANLSASVTDLEQAVPPADEKTILNSYPFNDQDAKASAQMKVTHQIQYGIPFRGKFTGKKKSQKPGEVRLYSSSDDVGLTLIPDEQGSFSYEIQLMDTIDLYLEAVTTRGKPATVVVDSIPAPRPKHEAPDPLGVEFYVPDDRSKTHIPDELAQARMLKTVTITEKRIIPRAEKPFNIDHKVDNKWLRSTMAIDLLSALQRRIPGLRILYKQLNGFPVKYVVLSGNFSFQGIQEPLVIVDGIAIQADETTMGERLAQMTTVEIEDVEVINSANAALYGARGSNGVIIVTTARGRQAETVAVEHDLSKMQQLNLHGFSTVESFEPPDYNVRKGEDTDVRSTIYWNPDITTTGKEATALTFYTADLPGTYRIVVEGVTTDGTPVRAEKFIQIRRD